MFRNLSVSVGLTDLFLVAVILPATLVTAFGLMAFLGDAFLGLAACAFSIILAERLKATSADLVNTKKELIELKANKSN